METTYLAGDTGCRPGESPKEHYQRLIAMKVALDFELSVARCANCEYREKSYCNNYHNNITEDFLYEPNQCPSHSAEIPF